MKKYLVGAAILVAVVFSVLLYVRWLPKRASDTQQMAAPNEQATEAPTTENVLSNYSGILEATQRVEVMTITEAGTITNVPVELPAGIAELVKGRQAALLRDFSWPISFYGKVVDQNTNPIVKADVLFMWNDTSPTGTSKTGTFSDKNGLFSLEGAKGRGMSVYVSKPGYYTLKDQAISFDYEQDFGSQHRPDPNNPVIFRLRKKGPGVDLITSQYGVAPELKVTAPRNGVPVLVDLMERKVGSIGQLKISQNKPEYLQAKQATEWSFRMEIPDGGFVEQNDEFPFEAPASGYQPIVDFHFKAGETNWTRSLTKNYYITFGQPPRFGRLSMETSIGLGVTLHYAVNPDGSRNLEPK